MLTDIQLDELPKAAQKALDPSSPAALRAMAAKGILPGLKPAEIVIVVAWLTEETDAKLSSSASETLAQLPPPVLNGALSQDLPGSVIEKLAYAQGSSHAVIEALLRMPRINGAALQHLAERADERAGELIATNEQLMLKHPTVIEKLYMNRRVRMSTADRLIELAVRNGLELAIPAFKEAATAIKNELIAEASAEPTFDDELFVATEKVAEQTPIEEAENDTHEVTDEGEEQLKTKFLPLHAQIAQMTVSQRIRRAMLGSAAERLILVRDPNRLVAVAAAKSPQLKESEAAQISSSRSVSEDVLRAIANNREFTRSYQIKLNLVQNPRTPFSFAIRLVSHLRDGDLKAIARSKNVSGAIAQVVQAQIARKSPGR